MRNSFPECLGLSARVAVGTGGEAVRATFTLAEDTRIWDVVVPIQANEPRKTALLDAFAKLESQLGIVVGRTRPPSVGKPAPPAAVLPSISVRFPVPPVVAGTSVEQLCRLVDDRLSVLGEVMDDLAKRGQIDPEVLKVLADTVEQFSSFAREQTRAARELAAKAGSAGPET